MRVFRTAAAILIGLQFFLCVMLWHRLNADGEGIDPLTEDDIVYLESRDLLNRRISAINDLRAYWSSNAEKGCSQRILLSTTSAATTEQAKYQLLPFIQYHTALGVTDFVVFYDGAEDSKVVSLLRALSHTVVICLAATRIDLPPDLLPLSPSINALQAKLQQVKNDYIGNRQLIRKQVENLRVAINIAKIRKADWILHLDADEILIPSLLNRCQTIQSMLCNSGNHIQSIRFYNLEAVPEDEDIETPFEISLFKESPSRIPVSVYNEDARKLAEAQVHPGSIVFVSTLNQSFIIARSLLHFETKQGNGEFFLSYANGKAIARMAEGLIVDSPHRFAVSGDRSTDFSETVATDGVLLHFPLSRPLDLLHRARRSCNITNISEARECFLLDFDYRAYVTSVLGTRGRQREFYLRHVMAPHADLVRELLQAGILVRVDSYYLDISTAFHANSIIRDAWANCDPPL